MLSQVYKHALVYATFQHVRNQTRSCIILMTLTPYLNISPGPHSQIHGNTNMHETRQILFQTDRPV